MDDFEIYAEQIIVHKIRSAWFEMSRMFNQVASAHNITLSVGFTLISIFEEDGTPVTKIAPRMGMEPNSLSRILKSMEKEGLVERISDKKDKRKVLVKLTEKGLKTILGVNKYPNKKDTRLKSTVKPFEFERLSEKLENNLRNSNS